eukprot:6635674-Pyramimonas_sp.AAC.1
MVAVHKHTSIDADGDAGGDGDDANNSSIRTNNDSTHKFTINDLMLNMKVFSIPKTRNSHSGNIDKTTDYSLQY